MQDMAMPLYAGGMWLMYDREDMWRLIYEVFIYSYDACQH